MGLVYFVELKGTLSQEKAKEILDVVTKWKLKGVCKE